MKKKMLLLALVIPLVFIVGLLSLGKVAGIYVDIPASGIHITTSNDNGFIDIDMANYNDDLFINAQVEPTYTSNKKYNYEIEQVGDSKLANINIDENGKVLINSDGKAKVSVVSQDKGFKDSVILNIKSSKVLDVTPHIEMVGGDSIELNQNSENKYSVDLNSGIYDFSSVIYPNELQDASIKWTTENSNVLEINEVTGRAQAKLSGNTKVYANCSSGINGGVKAEVDVTVLKNDSESGLNINGLRDNTVKSNIGTNKVEVLFEKTTDNLNDIVPDGIDISYLQNISIDPIKGTTNQYKAVITLLDNHPNEINLEFTLGGVGEKSNLKLVFADFSMSIMTGYHREPSNNLIYQKNNSKVSYVAVGDPSDDGITYEWIVDNENVNLVQKGNTCEISANNLGDVTLIVNAYEGEVLKAREQKTIKVIRGVSSIEFMDNAKSHGIEQILALGDTEIKNNAYSLTRPELKIRMNYDDGEGELYSGKGIDFNSLDNSILTPFKTIDKFKVKVENDGVTELVANWEFNKYFGVNVSSKIKLRGVKDGVYINNDADLKKATNDGKPVILNSNIMLGHKGMTVSELNAYASEMPTSYDWKFYENGGKGQPNIKYLIEFKNNVFGNGYEINADYITTAKDSAGVPLLFKGPLDFVSIATAAVKAQDNAVFLVRTKDVIIDNVVLKGCSDDSLYEDNNFDLRKLDYVGTTLDVMADCNIYNSRISNGRTVVRIFGGDSKNQNPIVNDPKLVNVEKERINVNIESSILSNAREFILKIGSNRGVLAEGNTEQTFKQYSFKKANGENYNAYDERNINDEYFYNNFVITDVNLKDSVLTTSGLFSVGMETHFGGIMLSGLGSTVINNWTELAATSFASTLNIDGDVKLLDWKKLSNVDSSTLIETTVNAKQFLTLDVAKMIEKAVSVKPSYKELIAIKDNEQYVHGGIAMYGGGINYSTVTFNGATSEKLSKYRVNLSILAEGEDNDVSNSVYLQGTMLPLAAGNHDFTFYMYNNKSKNNINSQIDAIANGSAFKLPIAKF